jgi:hypothetical protein
MEFRNHTPFPALAFEGIDPSGQQFHVVVMRQTFTWCDNGVAYYADEQEPVYEEDTYFGAIATSAVRQESDLCHYKPRCDIIVNATAYAPQGLRQRRFSVGLRVFRPDEPVRLPEPPRGLNPFLAPSQDALDA